MKRKFFIIIILIIITFSIFSEDNDSAFFYIPSMEEIQLVLNMSNYLKEWDKTKKAKIDKNALFAMYDRLLNKNTMESLFFHAFLRITKNENIKKELINYIKENNLKDNFSQAIFRLYQSKEKFMGNDGGIKKYQYNYNDEYFDEHINLFYMREVYFFDNELGFMLFEDWPAFVFSGNKNMVTFIVGGGTHSISLYVEKVSNIDLDSYKKQYIDNSNQKGLADKWTTHELPIAGVFEHANADNIFFSAGMKRQDWGISNAVCQINLYSKELKTGYSLTFTDYVSGINNNHSYIERIISHLGLQLTLAFINKKTTTN